MVKLAIYCVKVAIKAIRFWILDFGLLRLRSVQVAQSNDFGFWIVATALSRFLGEIFCFWSKAVNFLQQSTVQKFYTIN
ncbi:MULTISPECIES: hypothetical protein [unclassified Nostoc]|uniref:hypothetical protein n=1 Tax=unclassified Nostoc TaxID=2593658 RepID=UPI0025EC0848|nr:MULTISPECIES: hypothetical protein [unclassified Nostoc]